MFVFQYWERRLLRVASILHVLDPSGQKRVVGQNRNVPIRKRYAERVLRKYWAELSPIRKIVFPQAH